jgi:D-alanyl-D-alanine dipeptidase
VNFAVALFLTLTQVLGLGEGSKPLFCADRTTLQLRESTVRSGCYETERSLGAASITKAKANATRLHPKLKLRFDVAQKAARSEGFNLYIASGFRTLERQQFLFQRAIAKYGSETEAAKWVLPPDLSSHPRGLAIDVNYPNDPSGAAWLEENGFRYGLCRVFDNEWWHFEATTIPGQPCPSRLKNAQELLD